MEDEITTAEAAKLIGVSQRQIQVYFRAGLIQGRELSPRLILLKRGSVEKFKRPIHPKGRWGIGPKPMKRASKARPKKRPKK